MNLVFKDKSLRKQVLSLIIPFFLLEVILVLINFLTPLMFNPGRSDEVIAGLGAASLVYFLFSNVTGALVVLGLLFISQHYGEKRYDYVEKDLYLSLKITAVISIIFFVLSIAIPSQIISIFIPNQYEAIEYGAKYLRIFSVSFLFTGFSLIYYSFMKITGLQKQTIINMCATLGILIILYSIFIFGTNMALEGVAISIVVARFIELILNFVTVQMKSKIKFNFKNFLKNDHQLFKSFIKRGGPLTIARLSWAFGFLMISIIMGQLAKGMAEEEAKNMLAASAIVNNVINIMMCLPNCVAPTISVIVGRALGANKLEEAKESAKQILRFTIIIALLAVGVILISYPIVYATHINVSSDPDTANYLFYFTLIVAGCTIPRCFNGAIENGVLNVGGDNFYICLVDGLTAWVVPVALGFIGLHCGWHPFAIYAVLQLEEVVKFPINLIRYKTYKWVRNINTLNKKHYAK